MLAFYLILFTKVAERDMDRARCIQFKTRIQYPNRHTFTKIALPVGFRDIEHTVRKEDWVYRIVVLGDSMTLSLTVDLEQTYPKVLERLLNESELGMRFEVFNLGMWSFGAGQEYLSLKHYGLRYRARHGNLGMLS